MVRTIVGWFAVVSGLLLAVHMGYRVYGVLRAGDLVGPRYVQVTILGLLSLSGVVLVVFGLRRLTDRQKTGKR